MTDIEKQTEDEVDRIMHETPHPRLTRRERFYRVLAWITAVVAVGTAVQVVRQTDALGHLAMCTNTNLGQRNGPNVRDRVATDRLFATQRAALLVLKNPTSTQADKDAAVATYLGAYTVYAQTRAADDAARAKHPIGKC